MLGDERQGFLDWGATLEGASKAVLGDDKRSCSFGHYSVLVSQCYLYADANTR